LYSHYDDAEKLDDKARSRTPDLFAATCLIIEIRQVT